MLAGLKFNLHAFFFGLRTFVDLHFLFHVWLIPEELQDIFYILEKQYAKKT